MYNNASREYTAITKFENLQQRNQDFYSFFLEFLGLISKLNWNKAAKVTTLQQAILDEIKAQLMGKDLPKDLAEFAIIY